MRQSCACEAAAATALVTLKDIKGHNSCPLLRPGGALETVLEHKGTVLRVDVARKSWAMFGGKVVPQGRYKYSGGVLANDGL